MGELYDFSIIWGGSSVGDAQGAAPYSTFLVMRYLSVMARMSIPRKYGVLHTTHASYSGDLAPSNPAGTTLRIASGAAFAWSMIYLNNANVDFSLANRGYYTLVVRTNKDIQTARLTLLGPNTSSYPAPTHSGMINDLVIAYAYSDTATLTLIDARRFFRNMVMSHHVGESLQWYIPSTAKAVRGAMVMAGCVEPEEAGMGGTISYEYPRRYPTASTPITFFQATGSSTSPTATVLFSRITNHINPNYYIDSAFDLSAILWLSFGLFQ